MALLSFSDGDNTKHNEMRQNTTSTKQQHVRTQESAALASRRGWEKPVTKTHTNSVTEEQQQ